MGIKLQSFFILKFKSSRLKDCKYKIDKISLDDARKNGEVVRLGNSELIRAIQRIRGTEFNQSELDELIRKKKKRKGSQGISEKIDKMLYVPDIIDIEFDDPRHYAHIIKNGGVFINGKKYVRLLAGAGMTRRSTVMFCNDEIVNDLRKFLNCGRDMDYEIAPAKFNAYTALASSSTWRVSTPNFVVIPDCEVERLTLVDFLHESEDDSKDPIVSPEEKLLKFNLFDGQGLISPKMSEMWAKEVLIDYIPATWIFRSAYLKGMLVTFDFRKFAEENNIRTIKDIYGDEYFIDDVDVIVSVSQFKLWGAYKNIQGYRSKCIENDYAWGISRYSPKHEKDHSFSTYQYLQNLNIETNEQIQNLCSQTVNWFDSILGVDWKDGWPSLLTFFLGDVNKKAVGKEWFDSLDNPLLQALILMPKLINDKEIQQRVQRLLQKKIKDSYLGVLLLKGNYQTMVADPVAQAEWAFGLEVKGLLKNGQHYSRYWNDQGDNIVTAIRSPMTWRSEANVLHLQKNDDTEKWYKYINSGIIFNVFGTDDLRMSGSDRDGDICLTTNQKEFIHCAYANFLPPNYERKSAPKKKIAEDELWEYDVKTFKSRIGLITNIGTQFFAMLSEYPEGSKEYNEILNRLKICNCFQSMEIDRAKGIQTMDIPKYWTKWSGITDGDSEETIELKNFHNSILCDKRPYFFRYLYPEYNAKYLDNLYIAEEHSSAYLGLRFNELLSKNSCLEEEQKIIDQYKRYSPVLDSNCVMNKISHYMEIKTQESKEINAKNRFDITGIVECDKDFRQKNGDVIENIYKKYRSYKVQINYHSNSSGFKDMMHYLNNEARNIITSSEEIVYWASKHGSSFLLDVFWNDFLNVLKDISGYIAKINIPVKSDDGYIRYMNSKYEIISFEV